MTELQAESAFQARLRLEAAQRSERRAGWIKVAYYALGLSGMLIGAVLGGLKLLLLFAR